MKIREELIICPEEPNPIIKEFGFHDGKGIYNHNVFLRGESVAFRARSEVLIFHRDKVYLGYKKDSIKIPGGSWEKNEDPMLSAIREAQEEARINVKNPEYVLSYYHYEEPHEWAYRLYTKDQLWGGKFTKLYIAEYDSRYTGHIAKTDKDDLVNYGKFYPISKVYDLLPAPHRQAVGYYIKTNSINDPQVFKKLEELETKKQYFHEARPFEEAEHLSDVLSEIYWGDILKDFYL